MKSKSSTLLARHDHIPALKYIEMHTSLNLGRIKIHVDNYVSGKGMVVLG
jgi:hypothetical protein